MQMPYTDRRFRIAAITLPVAEFPMELLDMTLSEIVEASVSPEHSNFTAAQWRLIGECLVEHGFNMMEVWTLTEKQRAVAQLHFGPD
jgi:hypothetical protein